MQRLFTRDAAAEYLGMSVRTFDMRVKPHLPYVVIGESDRGKRYDRLDLDKWADAQTKINPAGAAQEAQTCSKNQRVSSSVVESGGSTSVLKVGTGLASFEKALGRTV
jgi:hypothetical protein